MRGLPALLAHRTGPTTGRANGGMRTRPTSSRDGQWSNETVPHHPFIQTKKEVGPGLLQRILKDAGLKGTGKGKDGQKEPGQ